MSPEQAAIITTLWRVSHTLKVRRETTIRISKRRSSRSFAAAAALPQRDDLLSTVNVRHLPRDPHSSWMTGMSIQEIPGDQGPMRKVSEDRSTSLRLSLLSLLVELNRRIAYVLQCLNIPHSGTPGQVQALQLASKQTQSRVPAYQRCCCLSCPWSLQLKTSANPGSSGKPQLGHSY